ncbi:MAG: iron-sulfur cluster assembly scaffold protein, partial [bacterium]
MSEFSPQFIDHFAHPRGVGDLEGADAVSEVQHQGGGCFDRIHLFIKFREDRIAEMRFKARACSGTIAACSALVEWSQGKSLGEVENLTPEDLSNILGGIPESKRHSVELAVKALR